MKNIIRIGYISLVISCCHINVSAQSNKGWDPFYKPVYSGSYIQDKNFYLLSLLEWVPQLNEAISKDADLQKCLNQQKKNIREVNATTNYPINTVSRLFRIDDTMAANTSIALEKIFDSNPSFGETIGSHLRSSGNYMLFNGMNNKQLFLAAWKQAIGGINYIIDEYTNGIPGRYPKIDSVSFPVKEKYYRWVMELMCGDIAAHDSSMVLFFEPSLRFALDLLQMNNRDEAGRFEPMEALENKKTFDYIRQINWDSYKYSVIMIPGYGPEEKDLPLNPHGKYRCRLAAEKFHQGLAPLIILSGGYVHPFQTKYCEAIEMKKELIANYGVPERAIIIEPHARHTTTNFRNANRLIYYYGIPADKKALVTTTKDQSYYISDKNFDKRNEHELGYIPYILSHRLSETDIEFTPVITSLHHDPLDPLDP
jgi:hypothetical protein